ncbi:Hypothetical predicted protein [Olea europaea subsp. europaea]|uniref:Uncharacterized protein n=1 Tax=Olea europaea subsp. europaea TaxID=158383 RepID=A0A8S0UL81_OLEEU|nr:Hypothetical predicted protein [Olea europaea subsp. europaea]
MGSTTVEGGAKVKRSATAGKPSFISSTPVSNHTQAAANTMQSSQANDFGVLEQYLGFPIGDAANVNRNPVFNPTITSQLGGPNLTFNKSLASTSTSFPPSFLGSQAIQSHLNPVSVSGAQHENWEESNRAESSSHTDTSTDVDPDEKNQQFEMGQSTAATASGSSDRSKEKRLDQKVIRLN